MQQLEEVLNEITARHGVTRDAAMKILLEAAIGAMFEAGMGDEVTRAVEFHAR